MRRASWTVVAFLLAGCVLPADLVRQRFSVDVQCAESSVQVAPLPANAYRAEGCGRTATYVCPVSEGATTSCIRESEPRALAMGDVGTPLR
jgi:hypothetical protein